MRVVSWNMGCGPRQSQYRKRHGEAWQYLLEELRPDVALVQEALLTSLDQASAGHSVTVCDHAPEVAAATAVLVRGLATKLAPSVAISPHTYTATAALRTPAGDLTVLSVHVYPGDAQHDDLNCLAVLLGTTFAEHPVLVGGDFNAARRFDEVYGGVRHKTFFAAMQAAGLHEIHWGMHGREVQTYWGPQCKEAYQDDHFFISRSWASRARACRVIDNALVRRLSDHGPLELDLDIDATGC
jgi:endonuclease/exonuclease/phosphatase family metal-dependent hydrolase